MATIFEEYNYFINTFNKKYGTNFSFEEYDKEQRRFDNFSDNFLKGPINGVSNEDNVYRKEFLKLYKQYAENIIFGYSATFFTTPDYTEFISDFEYLMDGYRSYCSKEKRKAPSKLGGWKNGNEIIEAMEGKVNEFTDGFSNKTDYVRNEYLAGRMPLRKMRADLEKISKLEYYTDKELGRIINYHNALENIVQGHTVWSYINLFRLGRTLAENREYKALNTFIKLSTEKYPATLDLAVTVANSSFSLKTIKDTVQANSLDINRLVDNTLKAKNDATKIEENVNKNNVIDDKNVDISASVSAQKVEGLFDDYEFMEEFHAGIFEETDKVNSFAKGDKKQTKSYVNIFILKDAKSKIMEFCANYDAADTPEKQEELVKQYSIEMFTYICDQMSTFGMEAKDSVVVGQKITDFILHKCTPFAFEDKKFAKYGDKYGVKDNSLLQSIAEAKGYGSTKEEFIENIKQELGVVESKEDKKETIPNLKDDIDGKVNDNKPSPVIDEQIKEVPSINSTK